MEFTQKIIDIVTKKFEGIIDMAEAKSRLTDIYNQPFMTQFEVENDRQFAAVKILSAQVMGEIEKQNFSKSETITVRIENKGQITPFTRKDGQDSFVSNSFVTAMINDVAVFTTATFWGDSNEMVSKFEIGSIYDITGVVNGDNSITINDMCNINISNDILPDLSDVINDRVISVDDMGDNISTDRNDMKIVSGTVMSSWEKVTQNDRNMGFLKLISDTDTITVIKFSGNPECVLGYGVGSMLDVIGQITPPVFYDDNKEEKYPVGMWGTLIVPILVIPPTGSFESSESKTGYDNEISGW